jgi:hypothetical protein
MSDKSKSRVRFCVVVLVIVVLWVLFLPVPRSVYVPYDAVCRASFAHRIADTDRVVGTFSRSPVSVTLTGDDARKVVRAVSSASSDRPPWGMETSCSFMCRVKFFRGTNVLDDIEVCSSLFLIRRLPLFLDGYDHRLPPFRDDTGSLDSLVYTPVVKAWRDAEEKRLGLETQ